MELATFSIVARCARTGELGVAVASAVPAVGSICPFLRPGIGAVSTQSWVNPYLALRALDALAAGVDAQTALDSVLAGDARADLRQIGLVDAHGRSAAWTGFACTPWHGQRTGPDYAIQGNMLAGEPVLQAMTTTFASSGDNDLASRLLRTLEAGDAAGGDQRGKQSASLTVFGDEDYPALSLRVDDHTEPVRELRRVFEIAQAQLAPFIAAMAKRGGEAGAIPEEVVALLLKPPAARGTAAKPPV
jgi:uncharacterized Ntn-hydrolase superfamily protein